MLYTATDSVPVATVGLPTSATPATLDAIYPPRSLVVPTDLLGTTITRILLVNGTTPAQALRSGVIGAERPAALAFGPALAQPTVTVLAPPPAPLRLRVQLAQQAEYAKLTILGVLDGGTRTAVIYLTEAYRDASPQIDIAMPDFSGIEGWDASWNLTAAGTVYVVEAIGWSASTGGIRIPRQPGAWMSAVFSGSVP